MRKIFILFILLISLSCEKETGPFSVNYDFSFPTEEKPVAVAVDMLNEIIYVANYNNSKTNYSSKIQKFNRNGELLKTIVDFTTFDQGKYSRYIPVDICYNPIYPGNLFVLVKPCQISGETWIPLKGFCILIFDLLDKFKREYDYSTFEQEGYPSFSTMAYSFNCLYVSNGFIIKMIALTSDIVEEISIQTIRDKSDSTTYSLVTDMEIDSQRIIYFTGQGIPDIVDSTMNDNSGCHVTKIDLQKSQLQTFYSKARTGTIASQPNNPGLAISKAGYIYLATCYGMSLEVYDRNNDLILQEDISSIAGEKTRPIDIALGDYRIYVVDNFYNQVRVFKYKEYD